jgi:hypothetical protein
MIHLSSVNFDKAGAFVKANARPLDVRLFEYYFEGGTAVSVLTELAYYQKEDGGFGHGIEPDFRLPASSPMATSVGLQYCVAVGADETHPIIQAAIKYLINTYDTEHGYWAFTDQNVNEHPHAPWWHVNEITPPGENEWPNVSAELAGYIHRFRSLVPPDFYQQVIARTQRNLTTTNTINDFYAAMCWQRTAAYPSHPLQAQIIDRLKGFFAAIPPLTRDSLGEVRILWLAQTPESILTQLFPENVNQLIDLEIQRQADDGGWWPTWKWGQFEDVWPIAEKEWGGKITVETLHALRSYGRIELS